MDDPMVDQPNYLGATIFWLYNIAALFFTALVVQELYRLSQNGAAITQPQKRNILTFSGLAALSFATLTFNMLTVLIQSFNAWSQRHPLNTKGDNISDVWRWSLTSTLFRDFGEALVKNNARYLWSDAALLATFAVSLFMGIEGNRRQVPRLWAFFSLSQILPISFTQNLFYIALLQTTRSPSMANIPFKLGRLAGYLTVAYCSLLLVLPMAAGSAWLIPLVLLTRALLYVPLFFSKVQGTKMPGDGAGTTSGKVRAESTFRIAVPVVASMLFQVYATITDGVTASELGRTLVEHPAVSSLGFDLMISLISAGIWVGRGRNLSQTPSQRGKMS